MKQARRLTAVVVTFNRLEKLQETVARLLESPPEHLAQLVVVDNASNDGTSAWLATVEDARLDVVRLARNLGGAGGFEAGMRHAVSECDPDWLLLMDDDARPGPGALAAFQAADLSGQDAVAAAVYYPDGRICEMNRPSRNPFWHSDILHATVRGVLSGRGRDGFHVAPKDYEGTAQQIDAASFVGLFLSRAVVAKVGLPNGRLFLYGDDVIYTLTLRKLGFTLYFDPQIQFEHDCTTFDDDRRRVFRPLWKVYYTYRNGLIMYHLAAGWMFWLLVPALVAKWAMAAGRYGDDRATYRRLMWRAVWHGLRGKIEVDHDRVLAWAGADPARAVEIGSDKA